MKIEIILKNVSNLDKKTIMSIIKDVRKSCNLPLNIVKDKIIHEQPIFVDNVDYLNNDLLSILKKEKINATIKWDDDLYSIEEYEKHWDELDDDDDYDDDEEFDAEEQKSIILQNIIKNIAKNILYNINRDNLLTMTKNDNVNGQFIAYYNIIKYLKVETMELGIDCKELEKVENICEKYINEK